MSKIVDPQGLVDSSRPRRRREWAARFGWLAVTTVVICVALLLPGDSLPTVDSAVRYDLAVHAILFWVWSLALAHAAPKLFTSSGLRVLLLVPSAACFGSLTEVLQLIATGQRQAELGDLAADCAGAVLATTCLLIAAGHRAAAPRR